MHLRLSSSQGTHQQQYKKDWQHAFHNNYVNSQRVYSISSISAFLCVDMHLRFSLSQGAHQQQYEKDWQHAFHDAGVPHPQDLQNPLGE